MNIALHGALDEIRQRLFQPCKLEPIPERGQPFGLGKPTVHDEGAHLAQREAQQKSGGHFLQEEGCEEIQRFKSQEVIEWY